jgi:hypothetical protein
MQSANALAFGRLWYGQPNAVSNAVEYARFGSRSQSRRDSTYDEAGNVIQTHEQNGEFCGP